MKASVLVVAVLVVYAAAEPRCPRVDPRTYSVFYRNPSDCGKYYECSNGVPYLMDCPPGLHFNAELNVCDWPLNASCVVGCEALPANNGTWSPSPCSSDISKVGTTCSLECPDDRTLRGSAFIQCSEDGWSSSDGDYIPKCISTSICVPEIIKEVIEETLSLPASLLFVLDESGSVGQANFRITKEFVKNVTTYYPLSSTRSAGVITFASNAVSRILLTEDNTDNFIKQVDAMPYRGGGTNILGALELAYAEIQTLAIHNLTLVFLVTDGISDTDGTPAADKIKAANQPIFTIGIGSTRIVQLEEIASEGPHHLKNFFHVDSYSVLQTVGDYLNPNVTTSITTIEEICI